jgi:serine/threonine protein kinase
MAPEIFEMQEYDAKADIWSVGCVFYEMLGNDDSYHEIFFIPVLFMNCYEVFSIHCYPCCLNLAVTSLLSTGTPLHRPCFFHSPIMSVFMTVATPRFTTICTNTLKIIFIIIFKNVRMMIFVTNFTQILTTIIRLFNDYFHILFIFL